MTRNEAKSAVKQAFESVADFNGDVENYDFQHFSNEHKQIFIGALAEATGDILVVVDGEEYPDSHYEVVLNTGLFAQWNTGASCIEYIKNNAFIVN